MIKNLKLLLVAVMLFAACFVPAKAQFVSSSPDGSVNLEGGVYQYLNGSAQQWVKVDLEDGSGALLQTTYTNSRGKFYFRDIEPNTEFVVRPDTTFAFSGSSYIWNAGLAGGNYCCGNFYVITAR